MTSPMECVKSELQIFVVFAHLEWLNTKSLETTGQRSLYFALNICTALEIICRSRWVTSLYSTPSHPIKENSMFRVIRFHNLCSLDSDCHSFARNSIWQSRTSVQASFSAAVENNFSHKIFECCESTIHCRNEMLVSCDGKKYIERFSKKLSG